MNNSDQTAFGYGFTTADGSSHVEEKGLTKREYFAAMAMQGFLANSSETDVSSAYVLQAIGLPKETKYSFDEHYPKYVSKIAAKYADALLKELETKTEQ
jgi:hypothetical protein